MKTIYSIIFLTNARAGKRLFAHLLSHATNPFHLTKLKSFPGDNLPYPANPENPDSDEKPQQNTTNRYNLLKISILPFTNQEMNSNKDSLCTTTERSELNETPMKYHL